MPLQLVKRPLQEEEEEEAGNPLKKPKIEVTSSITTTNTCKG